MKLNIEGILRQKMLVSTFFRIKALKHRNVILSQSEKDARNIVRVDLQTSVEVIKRHIRRLYPFPAEKTRACSDVKRNFTLLFRDSRLIG